MSSGTPRDDANLTAQAVNSTQVSALLGVETLLTKGGLHRSQDTFPGYLSPSMGIKFADAPNGL
eukprot:12882075-Prorocentrum_lima.AAC.1